MLCSPKLSNDKPERKAQKPSIVQKAQTNKKYKMGNPGADRRQMKQTTKNERNMQPKYTGDGEQVA